VETIGSKRSYALIWCMPNNDDDDDISEIHCPIHFMYVHGPDFALGLYNDC